MTPPTDGAPATGWRTSTRSASAYVPTCIEAASGQLSGAVFVIDPPVPSRPPSARPSPRTRRWLPATAGPAEIAQPVPRIAQAEGVNRVVPGFTASDRRQVEGRLGMNEGGMPEPLVQPAVEGSGANFISRRPNIQVEYRSQYLDMAPEPGAAGPVTIDDMQTRRAAVSRVPWRRLRADGRSNPLQYRTDVNLLFRWERRRNAYGDDFNAVFERGFAPLGGVTELREYVGNNVPSIFVSTTRSATAQHLGWGMDYRYLIDAPGGVDVKASLPNGGLASYEGEIAFPGGIKPEYIVGVELADGAEIDKMTAGYGRPVKFISNPRYRPSHRLDKEAPLPSGVADKPFRILDEAGLSGDGYATAGHWGKYGAAGGLIRHTDAVGIRRYLLVQAGPVVSYNVGKWQLPGGALNSRESPANGFAREANEEVGAQQEYLDTLSLQGSHRMEGPDGWTYTSMAIDSPTMFEPRVDGSETSAAEWFTESTLVAMARNGELHPALTQSLPDVLALFRGHDTSRATGSQPHRIEVDNRPARRRGINPDGTTRGTARQSRFRITNPDDDQRPGSRDRPKDAGAPVYLADTGNPLITGRRQARADSQSEIIVESTQRDSPPVAQIGPQSAREVDTHQRWPYGAPVTRQPKASSDEAATSVHNWWEWLPTEPTGGAMRGRGEARGGGDAAVSASRVTTGAPPSAADPHGAEEGAEEIEPRPNRSMGPPPHPLGTRASTAVASARDGRKPIRERLAPPRKPTGPRPMARPATSVAAEPRSGQHVGGSIRWQESSHSLPDPNDENGVKACVSVAIIDSDSRAGQ